MKRLLHILILAVVALIAISNTSWAVPARPTPFEVTQPNGETLVVRLHGDERFHYLTTIDGLLIAKNSKGYYCYAVWKQSVDEQGNSRKEAVAKRKVARNEADRSKCEQRWIRRHKIG